MSAAGGGGGAHAIVIAIDGPAASGKGTIARRLAARCGFAHLDTGLLYRAVGARALEAGLPLDAAPALAALAAALTAEDLAREDLRSEGAGAAASRVAPHAEVRAALLQYQRDFGRRPPGGARGAVIDGRDIGTVVFPEAAAKLFVTASAEERARRRVAELSARGARPDPAAVLADIRARDARDSARAVAPLRQADDALLIDTTDLDIDASFARAAEAVARFVDVPD